MAVNEPPPNPPHANPPNPPPPIQPHANPPPPNPPHPDPPPPPNPPVFLIPVAVFAVLLIIVLAILLKVPPKSTVNDHLTLLIGCVILILVSCIGLLVLIYMATGRIDLTHLLSEPGGGASLSRFQFLIFTFVIALGLFLVIAHGYKFPDIPNGILTLLGISASTYAVGKGITATDPVHMAKKSPTPPPPAPQA